MKTILTFTLCLLVATPAVAMWVEFFEEEADQVPLRWYALPDGSGPGASGAHSEGGATWDRPFRIRPHIDDMPSIPPVGEFLPPDYPLEDIWLAGDDLAVCPGGTSPDQIDDEGWVIWESPLRAGGRALGGTLEFYLNGDPTAMPYLEIVSCDMNGDLVVNLADLATFVGLFFGPYEPRMDMNWDGAVNLIDVVLMTQAIGAQCAVGR